MYSFCGQPGCLPEFLLNFHVDLKRYVHDVEVHTFCALCLKVNCREPLLEYFSPMADECCSALRGVPAFFLAHL